MFSICHLTTSRALTSLLCRAKVYSVVNGCVSGVDAIITSSGSSLESMFAVSPVDSCTEL